MDLFFPLMLSPAAFAAVVAALYWVYPLALLEGYRRFGGYLYAGLSRKFVQAGNITYSYFERTPSSRSSSSSSSSVLPSSSSFSGTATPTPTILFVHGFSGNKTMWMVMSKYLPKEWRLIMVDMPGHGESTFHPESDYSSYGMADKLNEFIDALDLKNVHLVGVSMGALISATYASKYQHKVSSISLMCIPVTHKLPNGVKTPFFEELEKGRILILPRNAKEFQEMIELVLYNPSPYTFHQRFREALVRIQEPNYLYLEQIMCDLVNDEYGHDPDAIKQFAKKITIPTHIMWGEDDRICHPSGAAIARELIEHAQVSMVEKCGHAMTMDRPRKCAQLIRNFVIQQIKAY